MIGDMLRSKRFPYFLAIVALVMLAVVGGLPHHHATEQTAHHCVQCLAQSSPAVPAVTVSVSPIATAVFGLLAMRHLSQPQSSCVAPQFARAPPVLS